MKTLPRTWATAAAAVLAACTPLGAIDPFDAGGEVDAGAAFDAGSSPRDGGLGIDGGVDAGFSAAPDAGLFFFDDFEHGTVGQQPPGWDNFIGYIRNGQNPQGATLALVDTLHVHRGAQAVHVHGGGSPAMLGQLLPAGINRLYVRTFVYLTRQLGMNPGANHETLVALRKDPSGANDEVRFGEIKGVIGTNEVPTDNISPLQAQWGKGPVVPAQQWVCLEVAFLADQPQHVLRAWADGQLVHEVTLPSQWQNGPMPANWEQGKFQQVLIGWHSFSGVDTDLWFDDVALGAERIGCD